MPPSDVVVTVRASASSRHPAELATVRLALAQEGPDKADVYRRTVEAANVLTAVVRGLAEAGTGPVLRWSHDRISTWFERPWQKDGFQGAAVHHAQARVHATFRDLDAFDRFLDDVGARPGVTVEDVSWALTAEHDREYAREVRRRAVSDALERARDYAEAAGLSSVAFVSVADTGLLDEPRGLRQQGGVVALGVTSMDAGGLQLAPGEIVVAAEVEARFLAT